MFTGTFKEFYIKYAPRWFRGIHWDVQRQVIMHSQIMWFKVAYMPLLVYFIVFDNLHGAQWIALKRPKNEDELEQIRAEHFPRSPHYRNYEMDQYWNDRQPKYDLAVRRQKYPQYYGDRYNGHKRWFWGDEQMTKDR